MFVVSVKTSKRKLIMWSVLCVCLLFFCVICFNSNNYDTVSVSSNGNVSVRAEDNASRVEFLSQFGWKVDSEPTEICEVSIPEKFNDTYEKYNQLQKEQGFNLEKHRGHKCKRFTYKILNYNDAHNNANANLLVFKDKIIGGDVSSVEFSGFMHGFKFPEESVNTMAGVNWQPKPSVSKSNNVTKTTYRENLDPDPAMLTAPTD